MVVVLYVISETICVLIPPVLSPKVKPIAIGIFYRSSKANDFLNTFANNFQQIDYKTNETYIREGFNIN